jgi:hypothetical protein
MSSRKSLSSDSTPADALTLPQLREENRELRAEVTRAVLRYTARGYAWGENADSKAWRQRAETAEAHGAVLRAHLEAIGVALDSAESVADQLYRLLGRTQLYGPADAVRASAATLMMTLKALRKAVRRPPEAT